MKALLYCTKNAPYLVKKEINYIDTKRKEVKYLVGNQYAFDNWINGTIPCECDYDVSTIKFFLTMFGPAYVTIIEEPFQFFSNADLLKASCLQDNKIFKYLGTKGGNAIHIKNLHVFDKPKELKNLLKITSEVGFPTEICDHCSGSIDCINCICYYYTTELDKAPQNMMYVFDGDEKKVLISIHPEHLCKILNGEKTIEVRKKVLKCMKKKVN